MTMPLHIVYILLWLAEMGFAGAKESAWSEGAGLSGTILGRMFLLTQTVLPGHSILVDHETIGILRPFDDSIFLPFRR